MEKETEKYNPVNEATLEHCLICCLKLKKEGKTIDDLISHIKTQLKTIKQKRYEKYEKELMPISS